MEGMRLQIGISHPMLAKFFHKSTAWTVEIYFDDNKHMPQRHCGACVEIMYSLLGLPGCLSSMDGVHFAWDKCLATSVPAYKGTENFPTLV
jgi:hypothetical protein